MRCKQCNKEYEAKRSTSKYCTSKCKQEFYRNRMSGPVTLNNTKSVTVTEPRADSMTSILHPAIIAGINRLTTNQDGTVNETERSRRMAIATNYERLYPGRPYTGIGIAPADMPDNPIPVRVSKPGDADYRSMCSFTKESMT